MYRSKKDFEYIQEKHTDIIPNDVIHHHVKMSYFSDVNYNEYEVFIVYRPILDWVKSAYSFFLKYYPIQAKNFSFDNFIENNGKEPIRSNIKKWTWNWFDYSPENMIINKDKKAFECKKYHFINLKNIKEQLIDVLEKNYRIKSEKLIHVNDVPNCLEDKVLTDKQIEKILNYCCPLGIIPIS